MLGFWVEAAWLCWGSGLRLSMLVVLGFQVGALFTCRLSTQRGHPSSSLSRKCEQVRTTGLNAAAILAGRGTAGPVKRKHEIHINFLFSRI